MQVANVNTIQTNLQNNIDTKLAVANATLQTITSTGATTTDSITVGGLTAASIAYPGTDGTSGQAIVTDGAGNLSLETVDFVLLVLHRGAVAQVLLHQRPRVTLDIPHELQEFLFPTTNVADGNLI